MTLDLMQVLGLVTGPAGALVVLALILVALIYGAWKLLTEHVIPGFKSWFEKQDERFELIMDSHEKDRVVFSESITLLADKLQTTDRKVDSLTSDVEELKGDIKEYMQVNREDLV